MALPRVLARAGGGAGETGASPPSAGPGSGGAPPVSGWRVVLAALGRQRLLLVPAVGAALLWSAAKVSVPLLVQFAVDRGILGRDGGDLLLAAGAVVAAGAVQAGAGAVRRYLAMATAYRAEADLRHRLFAHLQRLHVGFHDRAPTGQLMSRAATDLLQVSDLVANVPIATASLVALVAVAVVLTLTNALLALAALAPLAVLGVEVRRFSRRMHPAAQDLQEGLGDLAARAEEAVSGVRVVKGLGAEQAVLGRLEAGARVVLERALGALRLRAGFVPLVALLPGIGLVGVLLVGGRLVLEGRLPLGAVVAASAYVTMLVAPLNTLGYATAQAQRARAAGERVGEVLALSPVVADPPRPRRLPPSGASLRFAGVRFAYPASPSSPPVPVLDGFDLRIGDGELVALTGATGAGTSTVAKLVPRFYDVDAGSVLLAGVDVRDLALGELRRAVGVAFEEPFLFEDSVRANIAFAQPDAPLEQVRRAAALAGVDEFVRALPDGYDTMVGERGLTLSGGQRQRIALARAILAEPRVLVLDDPTSAVDPKTEQEVLAALRSVVAGRTTLLVARRPAVLSVADRVVLLDGGRVVAEGTHAELLRTSPAYRRVLAEPAGGPR
jgi:ATP-binding cassette subfamily B protein